MDQIVTPHDVTKLGTILAIWAHPDDETFVAGGLLAAAAANGQQVFCVTATRGEEGKSPDEARWPRAQMGDIRIKELEAALQELGVTEHSWLSYRDGQCSAADQAEATEKIIVFIEKYHPDSIVTFGPEGLTGHPDHQAVSRWARDAVQSTQSKAKIYQAVYDPDQYEQFLVPLDKQVNAFFAIDKPPLRPAKECAIALQLTPELLAQKLRALAAMPSQMGPTLQAVPTDMRAGTFGREYFTLVY